MLEWSIAPFLQAEWVDGVLLLLPRNDPDFSRLPIARHPKVIVQPGGSSRLLSVLGGLSTLSSITAGIDAPVHVLVHDVSRPCIRIEEIERLCDEADDIHGGLLALPVSDVLKREVRGRAAAGVDSRDLWLAQSPQVFQLERLREALGKYLSAEDQPVDEAAAMQAAGYQPRLVKGRHSNVKVTFPEDLPVAEFWLSKANYLR